MFPMIRDAIDGYDEIGVIRMKIKMMLGNTLNPTQEMCYVMIIYWKWKCQKNETYLQYWTWLKDEYIYRQLNESNSSNCR